MGKRIAVFLCLMLSLTTAVRAEGAITFGGGAEKWVCAADGKTAIDHLFGSNLAIMPGEQLEDGLSVSPPADTRLFLRCMDVPEELAALHLQILGEGELFSGTLGDADWIYLGRFAGGSSQLLELRLTVPDSLTPAGAAGWTGLHWQLLAESTDLPQTADSAHPEAAAAAGILTGLALWALPRRRSAANSPKRAKKEN